MRFVNPELFKFFLELARFLDASFFITPLDLHGVATGGELCEFLFQFLETFLRGGILFLGQGYLFDVELENLAFHLIKLGRLALDFHLEPARRLVHEVYGLVRKKAARDVSVGKGCRGNEGIVADAHTVVHFIFLLQSPEYGDGIFHRGLRTVHLLETAFERGVLFYVFSVFIERGRADRAELAAGQRGFQEVRRVHGAFARTGAYQRMKFVYE